MNPEDALRGLRRLWEQSTQPQVNSEFFKIVAAHKQREKRERMKKVVLAVGVAVAYVLGVVAAIAGIVWWVQR